MQRQGRVAFEPSNRARAAWVPGHDARTSLGFQETSMPLKFESEDREGNYLQFAFTSSHDRDVLLMALELGELG